VHFDEGDLLILDPMVTHSGSSNVRICVGGCFDWISLCGAFLSRKSRGNDRIQGGAIPARYVLFTSLFHASAIATTLAGLRGGAAVFASGSADYTHTHTHTHISYVCVCAAVLTGFSLLVCDAILITNIMRKRTDPGRTAVSPASKFPDELRQALPQRLRTLLEWRLPNEVDQFEADQTGHEQRPRL
jgi:hypothetical protein